MNIIFYRYGSICEPGVLNAFRTLGHSVLEIKDEITNKDVSANDCLELLKQALEKFDAQVVFTINYYPVISEVCRIYGIIYCSLIVDAPVFELYSDTVLNSCNRIFTFDGGMVRDIKGLQQKNVILTPLCADFNMLNAACDYNEKDVSSCFNGESYNDAFAENCTEENNSCTRDFSGDISFVGSLYSEKCLYNKLLLPDFVKGYIDGIIEAQLKVYGYNFIKELVTDEIEKYFLENQPEIYHFPERATKDYKAVIAHEVIGMKVAEQERIRLLGMLSDRYSVNLYTGSDTSMLPNVNNCGMVNTYTEMPKVFRQSKINLNMTAKPIQTGLPLRIFDVLACGGFLITNYQEQLSEVFEAGKDLEVYTSAEELLEKVEFYLKNDDLRQKIARNGYEKVKNNHTYEIRMKQILSCL